MRIKRSYQWFCLVLISIFMLVACERERAGAAGALRGDDYLYLRFPRNGLADESISLSSKRDVSRVFHPVTATTPVNRAVVSEDLWQSIVALQQDWCANPDHAPAIDQPDQAARDAAYEVMFQCGQIRRNPAYFIAPADLPVPLQQLTKLVPSTSTSSP